MHEDSYQNDLASIRSLMERSVKFMSLSGLSAVIAGLLSLGGSAAGYYLIYFPGEPWGCEDLNTDMHPRRILQVAFVAALVLAGSLITGVYFSWRKAQRTEQSLWNATSRNLLLDIVPALGSGGLLLLIFLVQGYYSLLVPTSLIFYGLALAHGSRHTFHELKFLGYLELLLGIVAAVLPELGLLLWALGFGVLHIVYGIWMYRKYDL